MSFQSKIRKPTGSEPDSFEKNIASLIFEIESNNKDLSAELKPLYITGAKEIDVSNGRKSIVIYVPMPLLRSFQRIHSRLVREIEKKFSDKHVVILGARRIVPKNAAGTRRRLLSQTATSVHDAMLNDIVFPSEIVGKRTRVNVDSSKLLKIYLDNKDQSTMEHKLETFSTVYKKLTGRNSAFMFAVQSE